MQQRDPDLPLFSTIRRAYVICASSMPCLRGTKSHVRGRLSWIYKGRANATACMRRSLGVRLLAARADVVVLWELGESIFHMKTN